MVNGPFTGSKERRSFKPKVASSILVGRIPFHDMIEPELRGDPTAFPDLTLAEFVPIFLERHEATGVRPRTISTLDVRMGNPGTRYGEFQTALITGSFSLALTVAKVQAPKKTLGLANRSIIPRWGPSLSLVVGPQPTSATKASGNGSKNRYRGGL